MLEETRAFYEKTKLPAGLEDATQGEVPITHTHVFTKAYPRLPQIVLPATEEDELMTLLGLRESTRIFSEEPLSLKDLAAVLRTARIVDPKREPERRTYPSGGARFPVELYVCAYNIGDLEPGAYHYRIKGETLELLLQEDLTPKKKELISPYLENPAATIFFTSVIARAEVKYGLRAYPYSLIEAGHIGQNMQLMCTAKNIGCCSVSGFVDDTVAGILDLTEDEIPIYSISVGKKVDKM